MFTQMKQTFPTNTYDPYTVPPTPSILWTPFSTSAKLCQIFTPSGLLNHITFYTCFVHLSILLYMFVYQCVCICPLINFTQFLLLILVCNFNLEIIYNCCSLVPFPPPHPLSLFQVSIHLSLSPLHVPPLSLRVSSPPSPPSLSLSLSLSLFLISRLLTGLEYVT